MGPGPHPRELTSLAGPGQPQLSPWFPAGPLLPENEVLNSLEVKGMLATVKTTFLLTLALES